MVSPSSRQAVMSKKSTSSLLERTRFTASPNSQTGIPLFVNLSSGSRVRLPARTTRLKLSIIVSFPRAPIEQVYMNILVSQRSNFARERHSSAPSSRLLPPLCDRDVGLVVSDGHNY